MTPLGVAEALATLHTTCRAKWMEITDVTSILQVNGKILFVFFLNLSLNTVGYMTVNNLMVPF